MSLMQQVDAIDVAEPETAPRVEECLLESPVSQPRHPAVVEVSQRRDAVPRLRRLAAIALSILAAVQFVGAYLYLEFPYLDVNLWERGYAPLPFQTRLLLAPLYRWVDTAPWSVHFASKLARNNYFFPRGVTPALVLEFVVGVACVLFSGWVATRLYQAGSRKRLLGPFVFPLFLVLATVLYIVHTVQNFRYVYDMPSLAAFACGFYLIYFRKPVLWFVLLFAVATLNRETTLLLLPFWAISESLASEGRLSVRGLLRWRVLLVAGPLLVFWVLWHHIVFGIFKTNASEYYPRFLFNLRCFARLRYWPQLACAFGFLWPFLMLYWREVRDRQLRAWLLVLPVWYAFMFQWAILTETRVFGELLPLLAPVAVIIAEELLSARVLRLAAQDTAPALPREMGRGGWTERVLEENHPPTVVAASR
ncbi:hypothetical protein [Acidipila sp. EB88]|uniref:hypothetical protein n=1 Tax=Acidipila sp. EB88 TaxID=2305226 RepID=UPI000F5F61A2|nr:hypothetical protein [Acidipila sp. EB88]RRA47286.1 hypothetical protein D1Y84_02235 [Acidipila sp. EB88]